MAYKYNPFTNKLDYYEAAGTVTVQNGVTAELAAGQHKITFDTAFASANYSITIMIADTSGLSVGYTFDLKETDGFTVTLDYDAVVNYIAAL